MHCKRILLLPSYAESILSFRGPLISDLLSAGYEVSIAAPGIRLEIRTSLEAMGASVLDVSLKRTGKNMFRDLGYLLQLIEIIKRTQPDLVLSYTIKPNIWGSFAAAWCGVRSAAMVTGLGYAFTNTGKMSQRVMRVIATFLYRQATKHNSVIVFQNPDDRDDFIAAGCLANTSKARIVNGSGVDCGHYAQAPLPTEPVFLMIARLLKNKGTREYGEAAVRLKKTHPEARCLLVGFFDEGPDGVSREDVDRWVEGGMEYHGPKDDVRPSLAACSVFVLPSYREGTPRSVLEAMAMGRPVITSDAPGCRETVRDGVNGYLVPVRDPEALTTRMRDMIENPDRTSEMGEESLRIAWDKYDVQKVNQQLMGYLGLLATESSNN